MTFRRTRCPHCKVKLEAGQRIHVECIDGYADAQAEKLKRAEAKRKRLAVRVERAETRRRKEADKNWSDHHDDAQKAVNAMVRARDVGLPCISCGALWDATFQAGHYRSRGAAKNLALDPKNIHGQCVQCNLHKHSNALDYRLGLIGRHGLAFVEAIEADNAARHNSIDDLKAIRAEAIAATKQLTKENG